MVIQHHGKEIARVIPTQQKNWRKKMRTQASLQVSEEKAFKPLDSLWESYFENKKIPS